MFGDASGTGLVSSWEVPDGILVYQFRMWEEDVGGMSTNYREGRNLLDTLEELGEQGGRVRRKRGVYLQGQRGHRIDHMEGFVDKMLLQQTAFSLSLIGINFYFAPKESKKLKEQCSIRRHCVVKKQL